MLRRDLAGIRGQVHLERCVRVVWVILGGVVEVFIFYFYKSKGSLLLLLRAI